MGAWIEMTLQHCLFIGKLVAPSMGAWIEMPVPPFSSTFPVDVAPSMGAWIEIALFWLPDGLIQVAPSMGAWIEINSCSGVFCFILRRSLYGSVD